MKKYCRSLAAFLIIGVLLSGCIKLPAQADSALIATPGITEPVATFKLADPEVLSMEAVADPSVEAADKADPYAQISRYTAAIHKPDQELYNVLYRAVDEMRTNVDISSFDLPVAEKYATAECLYGEADYLFFYLKRFKLSKDANSVTFIYYEDDADEIAHNKETMAARLSHLLNNVAPEHDSQLQKFIAVYQYICETSNYTGAVADERTWSPYSILVNGQGICNGFANLMEYTLSKLGVESEYISNQTHAWNVVKLNGEWYNSDVTWGAGHSGEFSNNLHTLLMDDETRFNSLLSQGITTEGIIRGYPCENPPAPPVCTDTSFAAYNSIGWDYAFDMEHEKVYFGCENGIDRMSLDGSGRETLLKGVSCYQMFFFNSVLYFVSGSDGFLYRLEPGKQAELLDGSAMFNYLQLKGSDLFYGIDAAGTGSKRIELLQVPVKMKNAIPLPSASIPRSRSFSIKIKFSAPVDQTLNWNELVYLVDDKGSPIPLNFSFDESGNNLTVRPKSCVADYANVTVYTAGGAASPDDKNLKCYAMQVDIVSK